MLEGSTESILHCIKGRAVGICRTRKNRELADVAIGRSHIKITVASASGWGKSEDELSLATAPSWGHQQTQAARFA